MNKDKKIFRNILNTFILVSFILCVFLLFVCIKQKYNYHEKEMINVISMVENKNQDEDNIDKEYKLKQYQDYYDNNDIVGRLSIDGTKIDTLLVQAKNNNKYYLNHTLSKEKDYKGSNFIDYRTPLNSKQINIYGHNSRNGNMMFSELENYLNKDFYLNHKYINLWDGEETKIYEIASVYIDVTSHEHIIVDPINRKDHIDNLSQSIYKTDIDLKEDDDLLILQTCYYKPKNSFLIVVAKKVN